MIRYRLTDRSYQSSFGIVLLLDPFSEQAVYSIWSNLEHEGITTSLPEIICAVPHLTLTISRGIHQQAIEKGLQQLAAGLRPFQISFSSLGAFPTGAGTAVFLQPTITKDLLCAHQLAHRLLQPALTEISPYYLPEKWTPHCSLGIGLPEDIAKQALGSCLSLRLPLHGQVQAVALVEMLAHERQLLAGCERLRFHLGNSTAVMPGVCPLPTDCPFIQPR